MKLKLRKNLLKYRKTPKGVLTNIFQHMKARSIKYKRPISVTLKDIHNMFLTDKEFIKIFDIWVKNGYKYYDKPSIDRIDPNKGYTVKNIQILSWRDNRIKGDKEVAEKKFKPIWACDMCGNKVKKYKSIKAATIELKLNQALVSHVLHGKRNHTGGWKFIYENPELIEASK